MALSLVTRTDRRHVVAQEAVPDDRVNDALAEARRVQIGGLLGLQQLGVDRSRGGDVAEAQPRCEDLRERTEVDRARTPARRQRSRRRAFKPEVAVGVVFDQRQAAGFGGERQVDPTLLADATSARVLKVRHHIEKTRTCHAAQRIGNRAVAVAGDRDDLRSYGTKACNAPR